MPIEIGAQRHAFSRFVAEHRVKRQLRIQPLLDGHAGQRRGTVAAFHVEQVRHRLLVRPAYRGR